MRKAVICMIIVFVSLFQGCLFEEKLIDEYGAETNNNFIMVHEEPLNSLQDLYCKRFAKALYEKTRGIIEIEVLTVGQFGNNKNSLYELQKGNIDFAIVSPGTTGEIIPFGQFFNLHFLFTDDLATNQIILDESKVINRQLVEIYESFDVRPLNFWTEGFMYWSNNKKITEPDDFIDVKVRTMPSPLIIKSYEAYGAIPQGLSFHKVFRQLQLGNIDGQENPLWYIEQIELHLVQNYIMDSRHAMYVTSTMINKKLYDKMSVDNKILLREAVEEATAYINSIIVEKDNQAKEKILDEGSTIIIPIEDIDREAFKIKAESVIQLYIDMVGGDSARFMDALREDINKYK